MTDKNLASLAPLDTFLPSVRVDHGDVLTLTAMRDGSTVRALSVVFEGRRRVTNETVNTIAARLVNDLETFDLDAMESFNDAIISGWEFDYSAHVGAALDRLADARLLSR